MPTRTRLLEFIASKGGHVGSSEQGPFYMARIATCKFHAVFPSLFLAVYIQTV